MLGYSSSWLLHYMHISKIPGKVKSPVSHILAHKAWITNILAATVNHMVRANLKGKSNLIVLRRQGAGGRGQPLESPIIQEGRQIWTQLP